MGRILGIDFGTRRVGAALSDPRHQIASPLEVYERRDPRQDARHYAKLVSEEEIDAIVVGLPLHTGGGEGELAALARKFGRWLGETTARPVVFFDERYTSVAAEEALRSAGLSPKERKARRDMLAAQILLQDYLDAGCPREDSAPSPLEDPD